jgi:hypothetical protein
MTISSDSTKWSALRCADRGCTQRGDCLRYIDVVRQSTAHPVAGTLRVHPDEFPCAWYLDPNTDLSEGPL